MTKGLSFSTFSVMTLFAVIVSVLFGLNTSSVNAATLITPASLQAGDLIRGESYSAVYYYGQDGFRYVFPNDKTYFTWYSNFDSVKWLSDSDLATIQIGGNVTYKPGVKMIKINSDPKVYAIASGGTIRLITSEVVAIALYGTDWNKKIDDVPDGFFSNYTMGKSIEMAVNFSVTAETADATSINVDKDLQSATNITVSSTGFSPASVTIKSGTAVRFTNTDSEKHAASANDGTWGTGTLTTGKHFSKYFKEAGTYTYKDKYGTATGTIVVE